MGRPLQCGALNLNLLKVDILIGHTRNNLKLLIVQIKVKILRRLIFYPNAADLFSLSAAQAR